MTNEVKKALANTFITIVMGLVLVGIFLLIYWLVASGHIFLGIFLVFLVFFIYLFLYFLSKEFKNSKT